MSGTAGVSMDGWGELNKAQDKAARREKTKGISRFNPKKDVEYEIVMLHDQPIVTTEHFVQGENRSYLCTAATGRCRHCGPKNKPSKKWHWLVLNRSAVAYKKNEETGQYEDVYEMVPDPKNKGKKIKQLKIESRIQVLGRGQRDAGALANLNKKYGGLVGLPLDTMKSGEGTSSAMTFIPKNGSTKTEFTEAEKKLLSPKGTMLTQDELRDLAFQFVLGNADDVEAAPVHTDGDKDPEMGEEETWDDDSDALDAGSREPSDEGNK